MDRLRRCKDEAPRQKILEKADKHTKYLFLNGFSAESLPDYRNHQKAECSLSVRTPTMLDTFLSRPVVETDVDNLEMETDRDNEEVDDPEVMNNSYTLDETADQYEVRDLSNNSCENLLEKTTDLEGVPMDRQGILNETVVLELSADENSNDRIDDAGLRDYGEGTEFQEDFEQLEDGGVGEDVDQTAVSSEEGDADGGGIDSEADQVDRNEVDVNRNLVITDEDLDKLATKIAKKLAIEEEKLKLAKQPIGETWIAGDLFYHCRPCAKYSRSLLVPHNLHRSRRGDFGFVVKSQIKSKMKHAMNWHENNDLHVWCAVREKMEEREQREKKELELQCGEQVICNVIHCLKHGQSSEDFVSLNNLNHLTPGLQAAVENNSIAAFFDIRELVFEVLTEKTKLFFGPGGCVDNIGVTLDKVTVFHISYTAMCTYYFYHGWLHIIVNELFVMKEDDYCSVGTARAVVSSLMRTLGVSRTRLAKILRHMAYDGVYATKEQRTAGGGSLSLIIFVARELGLEDGDITGTWDVSHLLQIIWNDVLKEDKSVLKMIDIYFKAMGNWRLGKQSIIFENRAKMLGNLVLKNKHYLTTRFVRSLMLGLRTAAQNLPTIIQIVATDYDEAALDGRNADAKKMKKQLDDLRSSRNLAKTVGVMQMLEEYCKISLTAQSSKNFPTQVWQGILDAQNMLEELSRKWKWAEVDLKFACIEAPKKIILRLRDEQIYRPKIFRANVRNYSDLEEAGLLEDGEKIEDLFEDDEPVKALAGEVLMESLTSVDLEEIETELEELAEDFVIKWRERQAGSDLIKAVHKAFGNFHICRLDISVGAREYFQVKSNNFNF